MINWVEAELRLGSLYEPVAGERFDLVISNPPYVISPPRAGPDRLIYREGDLAAEARPAGDHGRRRCSRRGRPAPVAGQLGPRRGQDWTERLRGWINATGCDAHVVQREVLDVPTTPSSGSPTRAWPGPRTISTGTRTGWTTSPGCGSRRWAWAGSSSTGPGASRPGPDRGLAVRSSSRSGRPWRPRRTRSLDDRLTDATCWPARWTLADDVIAEIPGPAGRRRPATPGLPAAAGLPPGRRTGHRAGRRSGCLRRRAPAAQLVSSVAQLLDLDPVELAARRAAADPPAGSRRNLP